MSADSNVVPLDNKRKLSELAEAEPDDATTNGANGTICSWRIDHHPSNY